eukprot:3299528-Pleurochrysis_carterae.AAC.1
MSVKRISTPSRRAQHAYGTYARTSAVHARCGARAHLEVGGEQVTRLLGVLLHKLGDALDERVGQAVAHGLLAPLELVRDLGAAAALLLLLLLLLSEPEERAGAAALGGQRPAAETARA